MTLSQKQRRFAKLVGCLILWTCDNGYELVLGEVYRTGYQQAEYIRTGKSKSMQSKHLKCLAIDLNLFIDGKYIQDTPSYKPLGDYWKSLDSENVWGGDWGWDGGHFQYGK